MRSAITWSTAKTAVVDKALVQLKLVRQRRAIIAPARLAAPTTCVNTTSSGVKCPDMTLNQPRRNNQMRVMRTSQMRKHGIEAHFAISRWRSPNTIGTTKAESALYGAGLHYSRCLR
jgi:hypothetical protein